MAGGVTRRILSSLYTSGDVSIHCVTQQTFNARLSLVGVCLLVLVTLNLFVLFLGVWVVTYLMISCTHVF